MSEHEAHNMKLIGHDTLAGYGGIGEGMAIQELAGGRRIMWLAHEGAPKNFTGVDVTDPRKPEIIVQTELAHSQMRSNSLDLCGDILAVAYQTMGPKGRVRKWERWLLGGAGSGGAMAYKAVALGLVP